MLKLHLMVFAVVAVFALGCGKKDEAGGEATQGASAGGGGEVAKAEPLPGDPAAGEAVYARICMACHGKDGRANGGTTGADFVADPTRLQKPVAELINSVTNGYQGKVGVMPPQKTALSEQEIKDAVSYVLKTYRK